MAARALARDGAAGRRVHLSGHPGGARVTVPPAPLTAGPPPGTAPPAPTAVTASPVTVPEPPPATERPEARARHATSGRARRHALPAKDAAEADQAHERPAPPAEPRAPARATAPAAGTGPATAAPAGPSAAAGAKPAVETPAPRASLVLRASYGFCEPSLDGHAASLRASYPSVAPGRHEIYCTMPQGGPKVLVTTYELPPGAHASLVIVPGPNGRPIIGRSE